MEAQESLMVMNRREFAGKAMSGAALAGMTAALPGRLMAGEAGESSSLTLRDPESRGISSEAILGFLAAAREAKQELHSVMILRHGAVVAEGWWKPYRREAVHNLYSMSKSFTSTAVGFAIAEGRLKLTDKVVSFFPDELPADRSPYLDEMTIQHLLIMSAGQDGKTWEDQEKGQDWVRAFLRMPVKDKPGTVFRYDSGCPYMLSAIIQKLTGQKLSDYLKPRFFDPLGMRGWIWDTCPMGRTLGSSGLSLRTQDIASFGQFYLQKGKWNGKQMLPAAWIEDATRFHIQQPPSWGPAAWGVMPGVDTKTDPAVALEKLKQISDYYQGYGYQFWRCRHNSYRAVGFTVQLCLVMPDQDAVIVITSENDEIKDVLSDLIYQHLLPAMQDKALPANPAAVARLRAELGAGVLAYPAGSAVSPTAARISGKTFRLADNKLGLESVSFTFRNGECLLALSDGKTVQRLRCGYGKWLDGLTRIRNRPGMKPSDDRASKIACAGAWKDPQTFEMLWRFYEMPHHLMLTCRFADDRVTISFKNSIQALTPVVDLFGEKEPVLEGRLQEHG